VLDQTRHIIADFHSHPVGPLFNNNISDTYNKHNNKGNSGPTFSLLSRLRAFDSRPTDDKPSQRAITASLVIPFRQLVRFLTFADHFVSRRRIERTQQRTRDLRRAFRLSR